MGRRELHLHGARARRADERARRRARRSLFARLRALRTAERRAAVRGRRHRHAHPRPRHAPAPAAARGGGRHSAATVTHRLEAAGEGARAALRERGGPARRSVSLRGALSTRRPHRSVRARYARGDALAAPQRGGGRPRAGDPRAAVPASHRGRERPRARRLDLGPVGHRQVHPAARGGLAHPARGRAARARRGGAARPTRS